MKDITNRLNLKFFFLIPISCIFIFQFFLLTQDFNQNYFKSDLNCSLQLSELETTDKFYNDTYSYMNEEVSVFPQYKNLFCLGEVKKNIVNNQEKTIYFYSSNNFYEIFNFIGSASIFLFFVGKGNGYIFFTCLTMFNIFNTILFYKPSIYSYNYIKYIFIYFIYLFLYFLINKKFKVLKIFDLATILLVLLLFFDYQVFSNFLIIYFLIFYTTNDLIKDSNIKKYKELILLTPIIFYLLRIVVSVNPIFINYWRTLSQNIAKSYKIFGDMQLTLNAVNCNSINSYEITQQINFANETHSCPFDTGYPLVDEVSFMFFNNIWISTLIISIALLSTLSFFYVKILSEFRKYNFLALLIFVSPPFNFLIERMNIDLVILLFMFFLKNNSKRGPILKSLIIIFSTFLKLFTFPLSYSYMFFSIKNKHRYKTLVYSFTSFLLTIFLSFYLYSLNSRIISSTNSSQLFYSSNLTNPSTSFGILSSSSYFGDGGKWSTESFYLISLFSILLMSVVIIYFCSKDIKTLIQINKSADEIIFIPVILLILLYENIDYRIPFLILIFFIICNLKIRLFQFAYYFLILSSAANYSLLNNTIDILNIFSQYLLFSLLVAIYFTAIKANPVKQL